jgi:hypothetical protein
MAGGLGLSEFPFGAYGGIHTVLGALPVLVHPAPRRVVVIGLGSGDTSFAAGADPATEEVLTVEIIGSQLDVLQAFQAGHGYAGLDVLFRDPRFRTVVGDGRALVRRDREGFDVIEADALRPNSAYAGNLYSLEYFALLRASLRPGGFAVTWVPTDRVRDTFVRSFPHVVVVQDVAIGSDSPIGFDPARLLERSRDPRVVAHFERIGMDVEGVLREFLAGSRPVVYGPKANRAALVDLNRDLFAKDEFLIDSKPW